MRANRGTVSKDATDHREFWGSALTETAMVFLTTRGLQQNVSTGKSSSGYGARDQKRDRQDYDVAVTIMRNNLYVTNRIGEELCLAYNRGLAQRMPTRACLRSVFRITTIRGLLSGQGKQGIRRKTKRKRQRQGRAQTAWGQEQRQGQDRSVKIRGIAQGGRWRGRSQGGQRAGEATINGSDL